MTSVPLGATTSLRGLVAVLALLVAGPGFVLGSAPAAGAATCTSAGGVSVVVDHRELGGGTVTACSADGGGKSAAAIFASVGVSLTYATRQPGFVCRVNGAPASDPCVNTSPSNAYWGLWWADGSASSWTYSSYGVGSLTVPAGGSVGWSWQQDRTAGSSVPPATAPPVTKTSAPTSTPTTTSSPSPSASASASPSATPTAGTSGGGGSASPSPTSPPSPPSTSGGGSGSGSGGSGSGGSGSNDTSGSGGSSATPSATPSEPTLAPESPGDSGDSRAEKGSGEPSEDPSDDGVLDDESPTDSPSSEGAEASDPASDPASESPGDSGPSTATDAGASTVDQPARIPAGITWSIVGLLAIAIAGSAVVARRRRGV